MTDSAFTKRLTPDERQFIDQLISQNQAVLVRAASRNMETTDINDINDCLQEVFLIALQNVEKLMEHPNPIGWLHITLFNIAHEMKRESNKRRVIFQSSDESLLLLADGSFEEKCLERMLQKTCDIEERKREVFSQLSIREIDLYQLRFVEKKGYGYIAEKYHTTEGCIRAWISQLKKRIKKMVYND